MSFYSAMHYTRRGSAPEITARALADFVRDFASHGIADERYLSAKVRCGGPIDHSNEEGLHEEVVHSDTPTIATFRQLPCEVDEHRIASLNGWPISLPNWGPARSTART